MRRAVKVALSLGVLAYAFWILDWTTMAQALKQVRLSAFLEAVAIAVLASLVLGARWYRIIAPHVSVPVREHFRIYLYATFLNSFTPANVGGDVYRFVSLGPLGENVVGVALALVRERVVGLVGYLLAYVICFALLWPGEASIATVGDGVFAWSAGIAVLVILAIALTPVLLRAVTSWTPIARSPKLVTMLEDLSRAVTSQSVADLTILLGLSFVGLALWITAIGTIARYVGFDVPWLVLGAIAILVEIVRMVPVSIQGIGVREATFALFAGFVGASAEAGFILAAVSYLALTAALLCCGVISWLMLLDPKSGHEKVETVTRKSD